ncbi:hypothetical protein ANN_02538 [Periplaneta americana]|uniref:Uncharacterized protein n=1 Tax=Periplaneta americana TaxID=6978 RepID=A0ABQ8U020_PERAM|nr:hypothetical protein ANN_02538 [Periplaneta americana]
MTGLCNRNGRNTVRFHKRSWSVVYFISGNVSGEDFSLMDSLKSSLQENVNLRSTFHSLITIAFVPEEDVVSAFELLRDTIPDNLVNLFDYVEHNYARGRRRGRGRQVPIFAPSTWNCYVRTLENLPKTTNNCEACHRHLNTLIGKFHPSFYHVLESLQAETAKIHNYIEKLEVDSRHHVKGKNVQISIQDYHAL